MNANEMMMEMIGNASRTALKQLDMQATDIWNELSSILRGTITFMEPFVMKIDSFVQHIQEGMEMFADKCYNFESVDMSQAQTVAFTSASILFFMVGVATLGSFVISAEEEKLDQNGSSPTKVLSIFELAKTAYIKDHGEQVMRLVDLLKFDVNFPIPTTGMSLLLCACISGEKQLVQFLLNRGGDISHVNSDGDSCLYLATFASGHANSGLLKLLIDNGCKVNGQNYRGNTPLHLAASRGYVNMIETLLSYGADPKRSNNFGIYPHDCAANAGHTEAAYILKNSLQM